MDFDLYTAGLGQVLHISVLLLLLLGTVSGLVIGALPGLSPTMAIAVLSPLTFQLDLVPALALLIGVYCGGMYGGSIGAILLNIPGHAGAVVTAIEGYPMRLREGPAVPLGLAVISSFLGGLVSVAALGVLAPLIANLALEFTFAEYFAIALFGLLLVSFVGQGSRIKAVIAGLVGVFISLVGTDPILGFARFTFGNPELRDGLQVVPIFVGLFGLAGILYEVLIGRHAARAASAEGSSRISLAGLRDLMRQIRQSIMSVIRGSLIGVFIGAAPGTGGTVSSIVAYGVEREVSKKPEEFGRGAKPGLIAAEASNNATTGGAMIPLLTLGIPGDAVAAILIGTFLLHGVTPGPTLFSQDPGTVSSIFLLLALANVMFLIPGLLYSTTLGSLLSRVPRAQLSVVIMCLCVVGTYSVRSDIFDVFVMVGFAVLGVIMTVCDFSRVSLVLGFILGSIVEENFRRGLVLARGDYADFLTRPIAAVFLLGALLVLLSPLLRALARRLRGGAGEETDVIAR